MPRSARMGFGQGANSSSRPRVRTEPVPVGRTRDRARRQAPPWPIAHASSPPSPLFRARFLLGTPAGRGRLVRGREPPVSVNGTVIARAKKRDSKGRDLPVWRGCHRLIEGEIFLVNSGVADSMDGRYFGVLPRAAIIGKAHLLLESGGNT